MTSKKKGCLIVLEGPDGCGKTTMARRLKTYFDDRNYVAIRAAPLYDTKAGVAVRNFFLDPDNTEHQATVESLFILAAHYELIHAIILPAIERGEIVIMDRSWVSTEIYQILARGACPRISQPIINNMEETIADIPFIEMTLLVDIEETKRRTRQRGELDRNELETDTFLKSVHNYYIRHADDYQDDDHRFTVNAMYEEDVVFANVVNNVERFFSKG